MTLLMLDLRKARKRWLEKHCFLFQVKIELTTMKNNLYFLHLRQERGSLWSLGFKLHSYAKVILSSKLNSISLLKWFLFLGFLYWIFCFYSHFKRMISSLAETSLTSLLSNTLEYCQGLPPQMQYSNVSSLIFTAYLRVQ